MRFLNTTTLEFEEVPDSELEWEGNSYAILSHRWGADGDEISYDDVALGKGFEAKKGFAKIKGFCELAASLDCRYGWVDTCCINKGNSSELAEAINSMYLWYGMSKICIVYLEDVPRKEFEQSEWFDRGWTLQELIAPKEVSFYDEQWHMIGTRKELIAPLAKKTKIPPNVLDHKLKPSRCSIAQRMSWAAGRSTKRIEDRAYSLMGLFEVNMPMIYGERDKAFLRLQQHIIQRSKDESIFAWSMGPPESPLGTYTDLYAPSPSAYMDCGHISCSSGSNGFSETNGELSLLTRLGGHIPGIYLAFLHCRTSTVCAGCNSLHDQHVAEVVILLARTHNGNYVRVRDKQGASLITSSCHADLEKLATTIHVSSNPTERPLTILCGFFLRTLSPPMAQCSKTILARRTDLGFSTDELICKNDSQRGTTGIVHFEPNVNAEFPSWRRIHWLKLGFTKDCNPILWLGNFSQTATLLGPFDDAVQSQKSGIPYPHSTGKQLLQVNIDDSEVKKVDYDWCKYDWPEGRVILEFPRDRNLRYSIPELNIQIAMSLLPYRDLYSDSSEDSSDSAVPQYTPHTDLVWTIDITEKLFMPSRITNEEIYRYCLCDDTGNCNSDYWPLLICLKMPLDLLCLPWHLYATQKKLSRAKTEHARGARERLPYFRIQDHPKFSQLCDAP